MVSLIRGKLLDTITRPEISGIAQQIGQKREALLDRRSRCLSEARSRHPTTRRQNDAVSEPRHPKI